MRLAAGSREQVAVELVVGGLEEDGLAPIATLRDMMRQAGNDDAGNASNASSWHVIGIREIGTCHRNSVISESRLRGVFNGGVLYLRDRPDSGACVDHLETPLGEFSIWSSGDKNTTSSMRDPR